MQTSATIQIFGYVGQDPRSPNSANPHFTTFSVSVNGEDKNKEKTTTWYECSTSNEKAAKKIRDYIRKGVYTSVKGSFTIGEYTDKTGKTVKSYKIYIGSMFDVMPYVATPVKGENTNDILYPNGNENTFDDDSIPF